MNKTEALALVKPHLKSERFEHTKRVSDTAVRLADKYGADQAQVELAAIFHDYAKYRDRDEMRQWITSESALPKNLLNFHHELWHGPVGAILVNKEVGIKDEEVLSAIRWHTTGKAGMSLIDKLIFLADYIEPGRKFPGVEQVRAAAEADLNLGCWMAAKNTIAFLLSKNQRIYPDTFDAYNYLTSELDLTKWRELINGK